MKKSAFLFSFLAGIPAFGATSSDWFQFRGPTGQGQSAAKNLPLRWSVSDNVAWKKELPGTAWSSPVLANGKLYLTNAVPSGEVFSLRALRLDADTAKVEWDAELSSVHACC